MDEVESIFTKHFANNDRKKAMKFLRPQQHKDSHMVTFLVGLSTGCFVSLFCVYAMLAHLCGIFSPSNEPAYMEIVYPVFSVFALLSLHLFMYGCNLFMWKNTRINYNFIFEFSPSTALKHRDAFLMSTTLMTTMIGAMVIHLLLRAADFSATQIDAIPGILLLFFIALLICPFDIFYRPTRYCFIRVIRNIVCSPFYKVLLVDFFMADQLTSQIPLLRHLETAGCHIFARVFKTHHLETCHSGRLYMEITYIISFLPYYWRALQCARRWFDDGDVNHLANMGKYVSAMVAAGARLTYSRQHDHLWFVIVLITSVVATMYQLYWDFIKDWGFLNPNSINPWLRDDLILKNKSIYYMSIALNIALRVTWVETIMYFKVGRVQSRLLEFLLAALEVIRRGHWNFYRLENEHLNNVGHYRAVKTVPLPFREIDSD
ncbi:Phosphate transporter PHO1 [Spatholobus suberectus]|nr:Phosphate transporter PHO1 [Spatholobus suberectus]